MSNELVKIETMNAVEVFDGDNITHILDNVEKQARELVPDLTTDKGRKEIASMSGKVASSKVALDNMGKKLAKNVKAKRKIIVDRLDALKIEVRRPLTDWENAEQVRVDALEARLKELADCTVFGPNPQVVDIEATIARATELCKYDWQDISARAAAEWARVYPYLVQLLEDSKKRDEDAAELARLKKADDDRKAEEAKAVKLKEVEPAPKPEIVPVPVVEPEKIIVIGNPGTEDNFAAAVVDMVEHIEEPVVGVDLAQHGADSTAYMVHRSKTQAQILIEKIESYDFQCEAGPLTGCKNWIELKTLLGGES